MVLLTLTGVLIIRAGVIRDPGLHVPPVLAYVTGAVFILGAAAVLKQMAGIHASVDGLAPLILAGLTLIAAWFALSPDAGGCSIGVNDAPGVGASGLGCRIPAGIGGLITGAMAVASAAAWIRKRRGP